MNHRKRNGVNSALHATWLNYCTCVCVRFIRDWSVIDGSRGGYRKGQGWRVPRARNGRGAHDWRIKSWSVPGPRPVRVKAIAFVRPSVRHYKWIVAKKEIKAARTCHGRASYLPRPSIISRKQLFDGFSIEQVDLVSWLIFSRNDRCTVATAIEANLSTASVNGFSWLFRRKNIFSMVLYYSVICLFSISLLATLNE